MWKPESVGDVIAEREFVLKRKSRRAGRVRVRFGRPIKGRGVSSRDPWWCPVEVTGAGLDRFCPVAGIDSLQALILALEFVTRILPAEAQRKGLRIEWLGDSERIVLARHSLSREVESCIFALFSTLRDTAAILASDYHGDARATRALRRIISSALPVTRRPVRRRKSRKRTS
jgi:Domain of unknown function (DUF6968)